MHMLNPEITSAAHNGASNEMANNYWVTYALLYIYMIIWHQTNFGDHVSELGRVYCAYYSLQFSPLRKYFEYIWWYLNNCHDFPQTSMWTMINKSLHGNHNVIIIYHVLIPISCINWKAIGIHINYDPVNQGSGLLRNVHGAQIYKYHAHSYTDLSDWRETLLIEILLHYIPNCMKEVTWLMLCPSTNGHRSDGLGWLPFI